MDEEIEIEFRPIKKVVILRVLQLSLEDLAYQVSLITTNFGFLVWAEGIAFLPLHLPEVDAVVDDLLKGTMYWSDVMFAPMPRYRPFLKVGKVEIPVLDQSLSPHIRTAAQRIREKYLQRPQT